MEASSKLPRKRSRNTEESSPPNQSQAENASSVRDDKPRKAKGRKLTHPPDRDRPLDGMVISISTLAGCNSSDAGHESSEASYSEMVKLVKDLGATVTSQICKKVNILVCTKSAVENSTQRVRKAMKQNKPIISVAWIEACRAEGTKVDYGLFRIDGAAEVAIKKRQMRVDAEGKNDFLDKETIPDAGWTEPVALG